jgi:hypothetical protein
VTPIALGVRVAEIEILDPVLVHHVIADRDACMCGTNQHSRYAQDQQQGPHQV